MSQFLENAEIESLEIQDPCCCADGDAQSRLINFVKRFVDHAVELERVQATAFFAESIETRTRESNTDQRRMLEERWHAALKDVELRLVQRSRRARGHLHDRFVQARLRNGDIVIWDLDRGIDGVMNPKWSCVVNACHQSTVAPFQ